LAVAAATSYGTSTASAVLVTQHPLPAGAKPAVALFGASAGLFASEGSSLATLVPGSSLFVSGGSTAGVSATAFGTGPDGGAWFLGGVLHGTGVEQTGAPSLFEITSGGPVLRFTFPSLQPYLPLSLAAGPEGAVWMTDVGSGAIDRWMPGKGLTVFPLGIGASGAASIVAGPNGHMWFTNVVSGDIDEIDSSGNVIEHPLPGTGRFGNFGNAEPYQIVAGPDGAVWFTEQNVGRIGRMTATGQLQEFTIPNPSGAPAGWFGSPAPRHIVLGPDGALWFTDPGDNSIGRITLAGAVTEYPAATTPVTPDEITLFAGELWFSEDAIATLGSVNASAAPAAAAPVSSSKGGAAASLKRRCRAARAKVSPSRRHSGVTSTSRGCHRQHRRTRPVSRRTGAKH
jgi:virginiamycin B lyase